MGLAKYAVKKADKKKVFLIIGILFVILSAGFFGKDIYRVTHFERVETTLKVTHKSKRGYKAYAAYEYQGKHYEDKVLSYYNAFTMKDGKNLEVLIDPAKPDQPQTTTFFWDVCFMLTGIIFVIFGLKKDSDDDPVTGNFPVT